MNRMGVYGTMLLSLAVGLFVTMGHPSHPAQTRMSQTPVETSQVRYLNWHEDRSKRVQHPLSIVSVPTDWQLITLMYNDGSATQSEILRSTISVTFDNTAQFGAETSLTSDEIAAVEANEGFTPGKPVTETLPAGSFRYSCPPWTAVEYEWAPVYVTKSGTCDRWGANGYEGKVTWTITVADSVGLKAGAKTIRHYKPFLRTSPAASTRLPSVKSGG